MWVAIRWDDLWIAVICQASLEIAGSPRKVFRDRGRDKFAGGRATEWDREGNRLVSTKLRITASEPRLDSHIGLS